MMTRALIAALMLCCWGSFTPLRAAGSRQALQAQAPGQEAGTTAEAPWIHFHDAGLSVRLRQAQWAAVLQELERHLTGIRITVTGTLIGTLTHEFAALPLEQGLRRLFRDVNLLMILGPEAAGEGSAVAVTHLRLFPKEEHGAGQPEAAGARRQLPNALPDTTRETAPQQAATGTEQAERLRALHTFAHQGNVQALQQALFDPDPLIQATAFALFAEHDLQGATTALLGATQSKQPERRRQALELLHESSQVDERPVLTTLHTALADDDPSVKSFAIRALADRGGAEAFEYLREALRDPDAAIRRLVLESVIQHSDALPLVQEAVEDSDETIRSMALSRLELGSRRRPSPPSRRRGSTR